MKIGDRVNTEQGNGVIVDREYYSRLQLYRYGVKLDHNPFNFNVAYYWRDEMREVKP